MAIQVICPGCRATFAVSDKFAGRTGPCPKCKTSINVPSTAVKEVTIHGPEDKAVRAGRVAAVPIVFEEHPIPAAAYVAVGVGAVAAVVLAVLTRFSWGPAQAPAWLLATAAALVGPPCAWVGYEIVRNRDLEPYRGRPLLVRSLACGLVYAALWFVKGYLPAELSGDMWPWVYLGPPFFLAGALAALAAFDLDWGMGVTHFSLYLLFTALLRWLAGFLPI